MRDLVRRGATLVKGRLGNLLGAEMLGSHLAVLFARLKINCVLDVGANVGQYGRFLRRIGYKGHIVSFEPVAANFTKLDRCCVEDRKWSVRRVALGDREGTFPIHVARATEFSSFLVPNRYSQDQFGRFAEVDRTEVVEMKRLDSIFAECVSVVDAPRVFLKLDTQGYDLKVLEGAGAHREHVRALQSELAVRPLYDGMTGYLSALSALHEMGFELTGLFPVTRDDTLRIMELDSVFIRPH